MELKRLGSEPRDMESRQPGKAPFTPFSMLYNVACRETAAIEI